jgi:hypothetical protein
MFIYVCAYNIHAHRYVHMRVCVCVCVCAEAGNSLGILPACRLQKHDLQGSSFGKDPLLHGLL